MSDGTPIIIKKKKVQGHAAHHGGSWKVAYADFVTAMMAFFMVMWIMGLSDKTRAQIQGYFNDPLGFMKNEPRSKLNLAPPGNQMSQMGKNHPASLADSRSERQSAEQLKQQIKHEVGAAQDSGLDKMMANVEIEVTDEGLQLQFSERERAFFELGSAVLTSDARRLIARIAPVLAKTGRSMMIDGHTDARAYPGSGYDNWDLSGDRANAMRHAMKAGGVGSNQIESVRANADRKLRKPEAPFDGSNRRVTVLLPFAAEAESPASPESLSIKPNLWPTMPH